MRRVDMSHQRIIPSLELEGGAVLRQVPVVYSAWGTLNKRRDNVILVCHSLTSNTDAAAWWPGLIGPGCVLDTDRYYVICPNALASPYGSASPLSVNPDTGSPYGADFPIATIRDTVALHRALLDDLGVRRVAMAIGGSMGGMQVLEWSFYGDYVQALVPVAVGGCHSPWGIAWTEAQRQAIYTDPRWRGGRYPADDAPEQGLATARMMAMISYRTPSEFGDRFERNRMPRTNGKTPPFAVESYLHHQGQKLVDRFDANCYVRLTQQMNSHDVSRGRGPYLDTLASIVQPTLVIGVTTDILYPLAEQEELARHLPHAELGVIDAPSGHDSFLIEAQALNDLLAPWMEESLATSPTSKTHTYTDEHPPLFVF
jgi:homoserine O-acetyltransferase